MNRETPVFYPEVYSDGDVTTVRLTIASVKLGVFEGLGSAKRHPNDECDDAIGLRIAYGRALVDAGEKIQDVVFPDDKAPVALWWPVITDWGLDSTFRTFSGSSE